MMISQMSDPNFNVQGALYFLDGHYLFRYRNGSGLESKFVTAMDVAAAFSGVEQDTGWLAPGIVRTGHVSRGKWFVYSAPPQKVEIQVEGDSLETLTIPIPRTVLAGIGTQFYLWALHSKHFSSDEEAFHAPFPNVHPGGAICWGTNTPGEAEAGRARKTWELFFGTPFNAHLAQNKSEAQPGDVRNLLRSLATQKVHKYPVGDLQPVNRSIDFLIGQMLRGQ